MIYYWTSAYPNGFPKDTDELLAAAAKMKEEGKYALTFKGSENVRVDLFYFQLIHSIGGKYTDEKGNTALATPETVQALRCSENCSQTSMFPMSPWRLVLIAKHLSKTAAPALG